MNSYSVIFTNSAQKDFLEIAAYIARDSPATARKFVASLRTGIETHLSIFPSSGVSIPGTRFRRKTLKNYVAIYSVDETSRNATVVLVTEGHRNWQRLLEGLE